MKSFWMRRPEIGSVTLSIVVSGFLLLTANQTFWLKAFRDFANSIHFAMFALSLALIFTSLFVAVSVKYLTKPIFIFLLLSAAPAAYFTDTFGTIINSGMIENAATTTSSEAKHLITFDFCWHLVLFGIVPALVVAWVKIRHQNFGQKLSRNTMVIVAMLLISSGLVYAQMGQVIVTLRQDHALMETLNPAGPVSAAFNYAFAAAEDATIVRQSLGMDARRGDLASASPKPVVTIVVAGETARAMNFSLNGYTRDTNPELEKLDVINYPHATSCGTDTAESLPCMFSNLTRQDFSKRKAKGRESLMDVIRHSGDAAYWWDNNTGSKGIADLINFSSVTGDHDPAQCANGECRDGIFLKQLDRLIGSTPKDTVIVLHQIGSHGPAYYLRYSDAFR
jgi:lipid A ethanolaminephosphotransferase